MYVESLLTIYNSCAVAYQAGLIEEMMDDAFESLDDQEDLEEEVQSEVDKVLWELTAG